MPSVLFAHSQLADSHDVRGWLLRTPCLANLLTEPYCGLVPRRRYEAAFTGFSCAAMVSSCAM